MGREDKNTPSTRQKIGLPSIDVKGLEISKIFQNKSTQTSGKIPNASLIYGVSSALLFPYALYHLFTGMWFTALLVFVLSAVLFGFALHFIRFSN